MGLCDEVRANCAEIAADARFVRIELDSLGAMESGPPPALDPERHYLDGSREDVAAYLLTLAAINFGSGWFPTLRKRPGSSGYFTIAGALADRWREHGAWSAAQLRALDTATVADALGQDRADELMGLYARALRDLGSYLGDRTPLAAIEADSVSAEGLAEALVRGMPFFDDAGFYKRAQLTPHELALAGVARFNDLDRLTIFADNLVPHVLRVDGVLVYEPELAARIDAGEALAAGSNEEREIRACAVHACELIASELRVAPRVLDGWLWNRGQQPGYKAHARHRTRTVFY
jgi:hypothetical protein